MSVVLVALSAVAGTMFGAAVAHQAGLTDEAMQVAALADYRPPAVTRVYAADGRTIIGMFSIERRYPLDGGEVPEIMKQAVMAIEDSRFHHHIGVDPIGILRAAWRNLAAGRTVEGGSTLTQQLTKILFLSPERTLERKVREALIALEIERRFSKEQIMVMYCNQIFLGGGAYGFEAGAGYYFSKPLDECSLEEVAMLAALPKAPGRYSPVLHPRAARDRRDLVLESMLEEGYIDEAAFRLAITKPVVLDIASPAHVISPNASEFGYAVEEVRQQMERRFGTRLTQTGGLRIVTTIDAAAQREAVRALRRGLHAYEARRRRPWSGELPNVSSEFEDLSRYWHHDWDDEPVENEYVVGLVTESDGDEATVRFGAYSCQLRTPDCVLAGRPPGEVLRAGDVTPFRIVSVDRYRRTVDAELAQQPVVSGALVCLDVSTGAIVAEVGGYDFAVTKFNNATQAERQTGSAFKPFVYAAAIEQGYTPDTLVSGATVNVHGWVPRNYEGSTSSPPMPLRRALAKSVNVPAVNTLKAVGLDATADVVRRFGLPNPMKRVLPSALGATEEPLLAMVSAYSAFPNGGMRAEPHLIERVEDRDGVELYRWRGASSKATSAYVAAKMVECMRGVVTAGTAARIQSSPELAKRPICGKTGTVNDFTDAWFLGYTPAVAVGCWVGFPGSKRSLGEGETGSRAALPVWIDFMEDYLDGRKVERFPAEPSPDATMVAAQRQLERQQRLERRPATLPANEAEVNVVEVDSAAPSKPPPVKAASLVPAPEEPAAPKRETDVAADDERL